MCRINEVHILNLLFFLFGCLPAVGVFRGECGDSEAAGADQRQHGALTQQPGSLPGLLRQPGVFGAPD